MSNPDKQPVLVYDGDCTICITWINYWRGLTGEGVVYRPYQETASDYPDISIEEFKRAIQLIDADLSIHAGAAAVFRLLNEYLFYKVCYLLYLYLPGFAWISECGYSFFSRHRGLLAIITRLCWGKDMVPPRYELVSSLFIRGLSLIYLAAFLSLSFQIEALAGSQGLLPFDRFLQAVRDSLGNEAWYRLPNLFWFYISDPFLYWSCISGAVISILVFLNILTRVSLILLYILYLSLFHAGQDFLAFQWDLLLLEAGFLAIFLSSSTSVVVWLYRWLVFRFMLFGGLVKILSADPAWDNLTALFYHFETQPLPTPVSAWFHFLPDGILVSMTATTLVIELLIPFLLFTPRRFRFVAGGAFILFQTTILLTGNYNFFNLLTILLCIFLFDDAAIRWMSPLTTRFPGIFKNKGNQSPRMLRYSTGVILISVIMTTSLLQMQRMVTRQSGELTTSWLTLMTPFHIVNTYGPFAIMTTRRIEINIEGSNDNKHWYEYKFKHKPVDLDQKPRWIIPHQPRLDWQMWFAALGNHKQFPWFNNLMVRLLQGQQKVIDLFKSVPFNGEPPKYIRAVFYQYHFINSDAGYNSNDVWEREYLGNYYPVSQLKQTSNEVYF